MPLGLLGRNSVPCFRTGLAVINIRLLIRRLFRISQTSTVANYVERFAELLDQLTAYEETPDPLHYTTRFLDGLQPTVRVLVALQQPQDVDAAYQLALLHEELGDGVTPQNSLSTPSPPQASRRPAIPQLTLPPLPPAQSRSPDDRRFPDNHRSSAAEDKWVALKSYRHVKGLCFICGEKYS